MCDKLAIGAVKSLKIDVLTETGWFDDARFKQNMAEYGGAEQTQYRIAWDAENAGGYAALLTVTLLDGDQRKILLDTGWSNDWMDYVFARHGVDRMLEQGEIDFVVLSHWHLDHYWGIESTLAAQTLRPRHVARGGPGPIEGKREHPARRPQRPEHLNLQ